MDLNTSIVRTTSLPGRTAGDPDAALVAAAKDDPEAFVVLYDRYFDRVFGYVRLRVGDRQTSEDVTSQVFLTALAKINGFRGHGPFAAWLFRIAANAVRSEHRRRRPVMDVAALLASLPAAGPGPAEVTLARERRARLHAAVASLRRDEQHLLALRYGAGMSFDEVADSLGIAPGTARVRMHRVVEQLRRRYPDDTR
jgi:RNA polymerase sigma-70 factor (ECF subfamily)